jgi:hypothetical protein
LRKPSGSRHSFRACPRSGTAPGARGTDCKAAAPETDADADADADADTEESIALGRGLLYRPT